MSNSQYVVVFYPDATIRTEVVGPFRSERRAQEAAARLSDALDGSEDNEGSHHFRAVSVIPMMTEDQAIRDYGIESEPQRD